ncbi:MAG: hypothetical protein HBSIN02_22620 [Bacteroidia bacterium]|nr:MAG: hypothetical protein HBSIN02_22620 [Bacteroidia bacterium]
MNTDQRPALRSIVRGVVLFSAAFAFVEASVVVYLRELYYPHGFAFPLSPIEPFHLIVELCREVATILMLIAAGLLAGATRWQKTAWFLIAFGLWDIFYYVWLKAVLDWPSSLTDPDVLFLIPIPWIGPVLAPVIVSLVFIAAGSLILRNEYSGVGFSPPLAAWGFAGLGTCLILYTFMSDIPASLHFQMPSPYNYWIFGAGVACYGAGMAVALHKPEKMPA